MKEYMKEYDGDKPLGFDLKDENDNDEEEEKVEEEV